MACSFFLPAFLYILASGRSKHSRLFFFFSFLLGVTIRNVVTIREISEPLPKIFHTPSSHLLRLLKNQTLLLSSLVKHSKRLPAAASSAVGSNVGHKPSFHTFTAFGGRKEKKEKKNRCGGLVFAPIEDCAFLLSGFLFVLFSSSGFSLPLPHAQCPELANTTIEDWE
ncbi:hypothetical protein VTO42DRAFT_8226 [Malbranchea cinnamomea]